ncbi:MAG: polysaccharide deacetylase family protein [Bacteroidota bacterium]|nr:polysaccharide deacetylase family protein [Bacteroidota bacterium]
MLRLAYLLFLCVALAFEGLGQAALKQARAGDRARYATDAQGAIIRGDISEKSIALVFTGDEFGDGGPVILKTLSNNEVHGSFFLTGNFYQNESFRKLIDNLKEAGHYLGAHSDKHLLYADWTRRDSLLVTENQFTTDLNSNYKRMAAFGIEKEDAPFFLPPYEWYNATVAAWTRQLGLQLVNFSPGTRSNADYTYPGMGNRYVSSEDIYHSIIQYEQEDPHGLNGFILLVHIGTDPRRTDKFYHRLDGLLKELKSKGYKFVTIRELLEK